MRKISAFSSKMAVSNSSTRTSFSSRTSEVSESPQGEISVYMTPSLVKMSIREMKRSINIRFLQLVKSCKAFAKTTKKPEDIVYLKRFMVYHLTMMLGEYVDMLQTNKSLQLATYLKIASVAPQAMDSARTLSRVMILANRIKKSTGVLPPKNQRDLNRAMDNFISDVVELTTSSVNVKNPLVNESLQT